MQISRSLSMLGFLAAGAVLGTVAQSSQTEAKQAPLYYELRTYTTLEGRLPALHKRFKDHTMKLFEKHGMKNVVYFTPADKPNTLVYLLAHKDKASRDASFEAFRNDPEWIAARDASEKDGKIVEKVESVFLEPTEYSPMK
ncbi:MAG: NIPSNAP family protein [Planctomycetaceae bacterium]